MGKKKRRARRIRREVAPFSGLSGNWHGPCKDWCEPAQWRAGAVRTGKVEAMKTMFAQAATFALSAAGALAILVGVIDHPQIAVSPAGHSVGMVSDLGRASCRERVWP